MLRTVRLELARTPEHPEGSNACGYELVMPLDATGALDADGWRAHRAKCTVRRFWIGQADEHGRLVHTRHRAWAFSYVPGEDDDEPLFRLETHRLVAGEYLSITEHDGVTRPFRVAAVA